MTTEEIIRGLKEAIDVAHKNYDRLNAAYQKEKRKNERLRESLSRTSAVGIITKYVKPPVPTFAFDWEAIRSDYDEGDPVGLGETEAKAIINLLQQEEDRED